jgi:hypothetical protein
MFGSAIDAHGGEEGVMGTPHIPPQKTLKSLAINLKCNKTRKYPLDLLLTTPRNPLKRI